MYYTDLTVTLLSMFRWKECGWKHHPELIKPDITLHISSSECMDAHGRITLAMSVKGVEVHNELVDESYKDKLVDAVLRRCKKDFKVLETFGGMLKSNAITRTGSLGSGNMFASTDYKVNFQHVYSFIIALDADEDGGVKGVYLVPSSLPAPVDKGYDEDPFYKMSCYERFN